MLKVRETMDEAAGTEATIVDRAVVIIHASFLRIQVEGRAWAVAMVADDRKVVAYRHIRLLRKAVVVGLLLVLRQAGIRTSRTKRLRLK